MAQFTPIETIKMTNIDYHDGKATILVAVASHFGSTRGVADAVQAWAKEIDFKIKEKNHARQLA